MALMVLRILLGLWHQSPPDFLWALFPQKNLMVPLVQKDLLAQILLVYLTVQIGQQDLMVLKVRGGLVDQKVLWTPEAQMVHLAQMVRMDRSHHVGRTLLKVRMTQLGPSVHYHLCEIR